MHSGIEAVMSDSDSTGGGPGSDTGGAVVLSAQAQEIADGYAVSAAALDLGALLWDGAWRAAS